MTLGDATAMAADERALELGHAQRRSWIFWAWFYGAALAITGAVDAMLSGLVGQDTSRGRETIFLGAPISAAGWLLTIGVRFSTKLPKPAKDLPRLEQGIRLTPGLVKVLVIAAVLIAAAMIFLTPRGTSLETLPYTGLLATAILSVAAGLARSGWLFRNSRQLYLRWLERRWGR
ncbi:hypothetical protein [Pseudarthrobacter chlorophenolicus]|uniref:hypothetical protein n=1 Tax=Pseudarthrobacter chlorophenolicus TaxID=85085 RepID=UPI0005F2AAD4|nr:hypothetical protein [Pseudarthrobacter chlorophenolicus]